MLKFVLLFFVGLILLNSSEWGVLSLLLKPAGIVLLVWSGVKIFKHIQTREKPAPQGMPGFVKDLRFTHFYAKTGIAVDTQKRELHLRNGANYKVYGFDQIRSWEANTQSGGQVYGGGINGLAANLANQRANRDSTGLFIKVKDLDHPQWKIDFPASTAKKELTRWMEILQQTLNESTV
jgi:hypothetical protein